MWGRKVSTGTFLDSLGDVLRDPLFVGGTAGDVHREARENQWSFALIGVQAAALSTQDVVRFFDAVGDARERQLLQHHGWEHPMLYYCWFDEQAVQLRCSLVSAHPGRLPFGCRVELLDDLRPVVERFLQSPYHDGIPWEELSEHADAATGSAGSSDDSHDSAYTLKVWVKRLPALPSATSCPTQRRP